MAQTKLGTQLSVLLLEDKLNQILINHMEEPKRYKEELNLVLL